MFVTLPLIARIGLGLATLSYKDISTPSILQHPLDNLTKDPRFNKNIEFITEMVSVRRLDNRGIPESYLKWKEGGGGTYTGILLLWTLYFFRDQMIATFAERQITHGLDKSVTLYGTFYR